MNAEKCKGGRPAYDVVLMFKILILQRYYNVSDDAMEYAILDRLSFMRFLGLGINNPVPDSKNDLVVPRYADETEFD
jgi:transposase